jgi:phage-related protein
MCNYRIFAIIEKIGYHMEVRVFAQVEKVLRNESRHIKQDLQDILEKLEIGLNLGMPHVKSLSSISPGLYEIRIKDRSGQFRVIYFIRKEEAIYLVHAFRKKTQKLPTKEIQTILKRLEEISR